MANLALNVSANNSVDNKATFRDPKQSNSGAVILAGLVGLLAGGLFSSGPRECSMGGRFDNNSLFGGRGYDRNYGGFSEYGQGYGDDCNSYDRDYGNYGGRSESSFGEKFINAFGLTMLAKTLLEKEEVNNDSSINNIVQQPFVNNPNASDKYAQLNDWSDRNILGEKCPNLEIVSPKYREIMDAYNAGGKKDVKKLAEAKAIYTTGIMTMARDSIKPYDTNNLGYLNQDQFLEKSLQESMHDAELSGGTFDAEATQKASQLAFKRLSHDGKTVTEKDLAAVFALADVNTEGHGGISKGNISNLNYNAVLSVLGKEDVYKNSKGEEIKNNIASNIQGAFDFLFPKAA